MKTPTNIKLLQVSKILEVTFDNEQNPSQPNVFSLPCEYLRVYSQSAEVTGHSPDQAVLQLNKRMVNITDIRPVGHYGVQLHFDDGHDTGIYSWERLYELGRNQETYWQDYLAKLQKAGHTHPDMPRQPLKDLF